MVFALSSAQRDQFYADGYLVIKDFFTQDQASALLQESRRILHDFSLEDHPRTRFSSQNSNDSSWFLDSGDKIRTFFEEEAFDAHGQLNRPKEQAVNKFGHNLAELSEPFRKFTLENPDLKALAKDLGYHKDPLVHIHDDNTFLYTKPTSVVGFWYALEPCTKTNGCLSFLPGSHKRNTTPKRFVRLPSGGTGFEPTGAPDPAIDWDKEPGWRAEECDVGTLVLIDGAVVHRSEKNESDQSRFIYTHHCIESPDQGVVYDKRNWLQVDQGFPRLLA